jgi:hypothetical protein
LTRAFGAERFAGDETRESDEPEELLSFSSTPSFDLERRAKV